MRTNICKRKFWRKWKLAGMAFCITAAFLTVGSKTVYGSGCGGAGKLLAAAESQILSQPDGGKAEEMQGRQEELYGIGSVSKVFTAAAVMKLSEEGTINLDAPLIHYLPEFVMEDERYKEITPRMLLNHSSGIQGSVYTNSMTLGGASSENHDLLLTRLKSQRLKADPGSFSVYCNDGFTLAELLVERVSGVSFTEYLEKNFMVPTSMKVLLTPQSAFDRSQLAKIYLENGRELPYESANLIGSGGIYSTAQDLCRFFNIFTEKEYSRKDAVLSKSSVMSMEEPQYRSSVWRAAPQEGSGVAYGLGWDTVEEYPYAGYGIKALSKGGDTTAYHAAVTVLPKENTVCSVLASGGSSQSASLAVEAILMEYLQEKELIESGEQKNTGNNTENNQKGILTAQQKSKWQGWYASGRQMMKIEFTEDGLLTLTSVGTQRDTTQSYRYDGNGSFTGNGREYLSMAGNLVSPQGGTRGSTVLHFLENEEGAVYLTMETQEYLPTFGSGFTALPFAQKVESGSVGNPSFTAWQERSKNRYLLASENFRSANWLKDPSITLTLNPELPDYLIIRGLSDSVTRIENEEQARFFQQIPGHSGRDLNDITAAAQNGVDYLDNQNYQFRSESGLEDLEAAGSRIVMEQSDEGRWFEAGAKWTGQAVMINAPENGHFYVYRRTKEGLFCTAGSMLGDSGRSIYLPENGLVVFTGESGAGFCIDQAPLY